MNKYQATGKLIKRFNPTAFAEWDNLRGGLRPLFDEGACEWASIAMAEKVRILTVFQNAVVLDHTTVLDLILAHYIGHYSRTMPHALQGLGQAVRRYAAEGFDLRVPPLPSFSKGSYPHPLYIAGISRLIEDDRIDRADFIWLETELTRLEFAIAQYRLRAQAAGRWVRRRATGNQDRVDLSSQLTKYTK
ncbi:MAG: hypothetical protein WCI73_08675 [Phycisphaerae bacterium]